MATILAVDDDGKIRDLLSTILRHKGHQVMTASDGAKGIDTFRQERPQILDIDMPDIHGITVLRQLCSIDPQAKVMVFTGEDSSSVEREARALGITDFLKKGLALPSLARLESRSSPSSPTAPFQYRKD